MKALTLQGWNTAGYRVLPGQKASGHDGQGNATFTRDQVDDLGNWTPPVPYVGPTGGDLLDDVEDV